MVGRIGSCEGRVSERGRESKSASSEELASDRLGNSSFGRSNRGCGANKATPGAASRRFRVGGLICLLDVKSRQCGHMRRIRTWARSQCEEKKR